MLAQMGWTVSPSALKLPLLRYSETRVPLWVLSYMILFRLKALIDSRGKRFEMSKTTFPAPKGHVHWAEYANRSIARAALLEVPCTYPDLEYDRSLEGAIRFSIERHLQALESQKEHGAFIHRLCDWARELHRSVQHAPSHEPSAATILNWLRRPLRSQSIVDGLEAIQWTVEERGLAGTSDLRGIPWSLPMDGFFEAWTEAVFRFVAQRTGASFKSGRKRETVHAFDWQPAYTDSQRAMIPDLWLEWPGVTLIIDAKYKRHWEELQVHRWSEVEEYLREQHRHDLFQVLAYANLAQTEKVLVCLVYPCAADKWLDLRERGRLVHKASIGAGPRSVALWLTAVPMTSPIHDIGEELVDRIRAALDGYA